MTNRLESNHKKFFWLRLAIGVSLLSPLRLVLGYGDPFIELLGNALYF